MPFNQDLDSARGPGPEDPESPKPVAMQQLPEVQPELEPDHAPAGGLPSLLLSVIRLVESVLNGLDSVCIWPCLFPR